MSNPFGDDMEPILEGFLCPVCKADLKTPERLTIHVEKEHVEEQDLLKSLKDMFITARKKIRNFDNNLGNVQQQTSQPENIFRPSSSTTLPKITFLTRPQELGAYCDHFEYFKTVRFDQFFFLKKYSLIYPNFVYK